LNNYNFFDRLNHQFFLSNHYVKKSFFELEKKIFNKKINFKLQDHVFICGLPRSGTTMLLNLIHETKKFASLTYYDMPLIMAPNLFSKFKKIQKDKVINRYHSDGLNISLSSPEAFDEVFLSTFNEDEILENYEIFVNLICLKYEKRRYLSKNNNNYKRIKLINKIFNNSIFLLPFRNPLQQANSLFFQNKNFSNLQSKNKFITSYMNYLGHNEFGFNHKYWHKPEIFLDQNDINYWLEQWKLFHLNIINNYKSLKNFFLICYEDFCSNEIEKKKLSKILGIKIQSFSTEISEKKINYNFNENLKNECIEIYDTLKTVLKY